MRYARSSRRSPSMLMAASGGASAQGVLIDKSEIRFVSKQMGVNVEGRFRKWKANVDFRPKDLAHSKAEFEIELASIDLASDESESEVRAPLWFDTAKFPVAKFHVGVGQASLGGDRYEIAGTLVDQGRRARRRRPGRAARRTPPATASPRVSSRSSGSTLGSAKECGPIRGRWPTT